MSIGMSLVGIVTLLLLGFLLSDNRRAINLRTVGGALLLQIVIGALVLYIPAGKVALEAFSGGVQNVINSASAGINFLFGGLGTDAMFGNGVGFVFAVRVLPIIIFFSALTAVLYYFGIMQWVIRILGGALQKLLGTSKTESLSATANIFVGQTEAPLVVKPYIKNMTSSELFAVMAGGLASVAGSVLAGYAGMGIKLEYLIAASFMAAPGGLLFAKLMKPEVETPRQTLDIDDADDQDKPVNVIDAAAGGASAGAQLAFNVGAMLIAFISLIALVNLMLGSVGEWFGKPDLTMELILGYIFAPLAFLIGVPWEEALTAGSFLGQKLVVNEFVAYLNLVPYLNGEAMINGAAMSEQTQIILSFALCGFGFLWCFATSTKQQEDRQQQ